MFLHPELQLDQFHSRQRELFAEADRSRLLAAALRARRSARASGASKNSAGKNSAAAHNDQRKSPAVRGRPDGNLAGCGARVAAQAQ